MALSKRFVRAAAVLALLGQAAAPVATMAATMEVTGATMSRGTHQPSGGGAAALSSRVPADASVYIAWNGADPEFARTKFAAYIKAWELDRILDKEIPAIIESQPMFKKEPKLLEGYRDGVAALREIVSRPVVLYVVAPKEPRAFPAAALMVDAGPAADNIWATVQKWITAEEVRPYHGRDGRVLWVGTAPPQAVAGGLLASDKFKKASGEIGVGQAVTLYVDVKSILKVAPQGEALAEQIIEALGFNAVESIYGADSYENGDWVTKLQVAVPGPRKGLVGKLLEPERAGEAEALLALVPADAMGVSLVHLDPNGWLDSTFASIKPLVPEVEMVRTRAMSVLSLMTRVRLQEELFGSLATGWVMYQPADATVPFVLVNKPTKPEVASRAVDKFGRAIIQILAAQQQRLMQAQRAGGGGGAGGIEQMPNIKVSTETVDGLPVSTASIFTMETGEIEISWASKNGLLAFSTTPRAVAAALNPPADGGIARSAKLKAAEARLKVQPGTLKSWVDLARVYPPKYEMMMEEIAKVQPMLPAGVDLNKFIVPLERVRPLLGEAATASWVDQSGWHYRSVTPFPAADPSGTQMAAVGGIAMAAGILLPSLNRARETAIRVQCASNLRQIGQAILLYCNENKGKYPATLGDLVKTQDITARKFACPASSAEVPEDVMADANKAAAWVEAHSTYVYCGKGLTIAAPPDLIVAYEKAENHDNAGRNVLFGDGRVEFHQEAGFQKLLKEFGPESEIFKLQIKR